MRRLGVFAVLLAACGGGDDEGEPIDGDLVIMLGDAVIDPSVGAAIEACVDTNCNETDPTKMLVVIGTRDISCESTVQSALKQGTYLTFTVDRVPATQSAFVSVIRVVPGGAHLNGSSGDVVIDAVDDRVTGSLTFDTEDDDDGVILPITAAGTFDVIRCF